MRGASSTAGLLLQLAATGLPAQGPTARAVRVVEDIAYGADRPDAHARQRLDLYVPLGVPTPPVVMFVHGGAWTGGGKAFGAPLAHAFAQRGIACACIDTRLFPVARPATMVGDCGRALGWLHEHGAAHGVDGQRLFVMGHSSGAHLVSWLALDAAQLAAAGVPAAALRGVIALSGVYELRCRHPVLDSVFAGDAGLRAAASPCRHAGPGDPPVLLLWGERDLPGLGLAARMLRDRLQEHGVPVVARELAGADHVDYVLRLPQPGDAEFARLCAFVQAPPAPDAASSPRTTAGRSVLPAEGGLPELVVHRPVGVWPQAVVLWLVAAAEERDPGARIAAALAAHGVATVLAPAPADPAGVAALWQGLRPVGADARTVPQWLGGLGAAGDLVLACSFDVRAGLRGRIAVVPRLAAGPDPALRALALAPRLLLVQGDQDSTVAALRPLATRPGAEVVLLPGHAAATMLRGLGGGDDVVLPLLRAFVRP